MPKLSMKKRLCNEICTTAAMEIEDKDSTSEIMNIFDNALDDLILLHSSRNSIPRQLIPKSSQWYNIILPALDDQRFRHFLRMSRQDFGVILNMIEDIKIFHGPNSHKQFPVAKQLAIALYKLGFNGCGSSVCSVAALFGVGDGGTVLKITSRVIEAILTLEKQWISWPDRDERSKIQLFMADKLPKCVGFVDGSHINLAEAPVDDPESYFSRKQQYAIQLQGICDTNRRIRNVVIGYPGSVHDARVFLNSHIGRHPEEYFEDGQWIAGDSAYGVTNNLMTPFRNNSTIGTPQQRRQFNKHFSKYRVNIECCFGILKEVFSSLKGLRVRVNRTSGHMFASKWILACCILYNIILPSLEEDFNTFEVTDEDYDLGDESGDEMDGDGHERRQALFNFVIAKLAS